MTTKIIDRKTGKEVKEGTILIRKDYKGFKHRYEVLGFDKMLRGDTGAKVRKMGQDDRWTYLFMPLNALQLDEVIL